MYVRQTGLATATAVERFSVHALVSLKTCVWHAYCKIFWDADFLQDVTFLFLADACPAVAGFKVAIRALLFGYQQTLLFNSALFLAGSTILGRRRNIRNTLSANVTAAIGTAKCVLSRAVPVLGTHVYADALGF